MKSNTAKPQYDYYGDFQIKVKKHHKYVKVPVDYYKQLEEDSNNLQVLRNILQIEH